MSMKRFFYSSASLLVGLLGGAVSFMVVVLLEGALAGFYPDFLLKNNPHYLFILLIPALVEEGVKIAVAKRMMGIFGVPEIIIGLGLGFGIIEAVIATSPASPAIFLNPLSWVHLIFLGVGYLAAAHSSRNGKSIVPVWVITSFFVHWVYDVLVYTINQ